ncbi:MAG: Pycsar system effector family protein [Candidatus Sulfotelmatobacter sp.]|jgi:hypothetical protein
MTTPETPFLDEGKSAISIVAPEQAIPRGSPMAPTQESVAANAGELPGLVSIEGEWDFLQNEAKYLSDYIRFADQKAGFTLTFSLATLGFLFNHQQYSDLFQGAALWTRSNPHSALATGLLVVACTLSLLALVPRLWSHETKGLIFWQEIVTYNTAAEYQSALRQCSRVDLNNALGQQCYSLAKVCTRKYNLIKFALVAAPIGAAIGIVTVAR